MFRFALVLMLSIACGVTVAGPIKCAKMHRIQDVGTLYLWLPQKRNFYNADAAKMFVEGRKIKLYASVNAWQVPVDPTWLENPFDSPTWGLFYNSLGWLYAPIYSYKNGNTSAGIKAKKLLMDWISIHQDQVPSAVHIAWLDQAVAFRLANLGEMKRLLSPILSDDQDRLIRHAVGKHVDYLISLFSVSKGYLNNHGFMDAMAVYTAGIEFHEQTWIDTARRRLGTLFEKMFIQGLSIEQSLGYHMYDIRMLLEAQCLSAYNSMDSIPGLSKVMDNALHGLALMLYSDNTVPAIGDTYYRMTAMPLFTYFRRNKGQVPLERYSLVSKEREGRGSSRLHVLEKAGYALLRFRNGVAVFDFTKSPLGTHGHNDGLNFMLFANGNRLIVDSGGPYSYHSPLRENYFHASKGHNVVIVDNKDLSGGATFVGSGLAPYPWAKAEAKLGNVHQIRTLMIMGNGHLVVHDVLDGASRHKYTLLLHLPPQAKVRVGETTEVKINDDTFLVRVRANDVIVPSVANGWVTPGGGKKLQAPVLQFVTQGKDVAFTTNIYFGKSGLENMKLKHK